tara:strand:+ start:609 stop:833 length:225 start_codon:yes stop_codon:yes gene_type:complete
MLFKQKDKVLHFIAGCGLSSLGFGWAPLFALGGAVGILKEAWDMGKPNHTSDPWDALATISGSAVPFSIWLLTT